ncbi:transketolase, partial [Prochlorococcus sp. AH-736-E02]|nr:transketolase [Prochlorococcus sp. AH-736-E02]
MTILLNKNLSRQWSRIGPRGIYGQSLLSIAEDCNNIFAISADLGNSSGLDRFKNKFDRRFLNIGIAEQNMIGFSSGLSSLGFNVFVSSFAPFITMRAGEQVRMNLAYMKSNVKLVAIGSGISMGFLGNSHFGLEDISIINSLPGIPIISPCDCFEVYKAVDALSKYEGPAFLRLTGAAPTPIINHEDYDFIIGESIEIIEGSDILILSHGTILSNSIKAAEIL